MSRMFGRLNSRSEPWRSRLSRQLAALTAVLTCLIFVPLTLATSSAGVRVALLVTALIVIPALLLLARSERADARAIGVVVTFLGIGAVGFATLGFLSGSGVGYAAAVAFTGLLLGRKPMLAMIIVCSCSIAVIGVLMVRGVIPAPADAMISPTLGRPWVRSATITMLLILIIGAAVTNVVESIEGALERNAAEGTARQEAERLALRAQSTQLIAQLAASLAHDVNNQLTVIAAWSEVLANEPGGAQHATASRAISNSITQAASLTRQMLMLGRQDAAAPETVTLAEFLNENSALLDAVITGRTTIVTDADADAACVIDPSRLAQVLLNLVMNARDATPSGGAITVSARRRRHAAGVGAHGPIPLGDWIVLSVEDNGVGMDDETSQRAFEPFFTTKRVGQGTGLGLATTAVIIDDAAGHLSINSSPGAGTTVNIWLPAVDADTNALSATLDVEIRLDGVQVLLVEDTAEVLRVAQRALTAIGASVTTAIDGNDAISRLTGAAFDVLCADVVMPGASLPSLIEAFRRANLDGAVLLCSGYIDETAVRELIQTGDYPLLQKPYTPQQLVEAVRAALRSVDA